MQKEEITKYLKALNDILASGDIKGELCIYGGTAMCLVYNARPSTKDVDAVFEPAQKIRDAAKKVAEIYDLNEDWLNDGVKGFIVEHSKRVLFDWPNLKVYFSDPEYLLAMKAFASRVDATDKDDIKFLIKELKIESAKELLNIIEKYYPRGRIKPATQFFVEELFEK